MPLIGANTASVDINAGGSASSGVDYDNFITAITTAAAGTTGVSFDGTDTLTFDSSFNGGAGTGTFNFSVDAIDDQDVEGTESIIATLSNESTSSGTVALGNTNTSTDITELDQAIAINLTQDVTSISEDAGESVVYSVDLDTVPLVGNTVTVTIAELAGGAEDSDLTAAFDASVSAAAGSTTGVSYAAGVLTFDDNYVLGTFSFTLTAADDASVEGTQTLEVTLASAGITNGTATITTTQLDTDIAEIDQTVDLALSRSVVSISEELGESVDFTVTLSQTLNVGNSVSVDIGDVAGGADDSDLTVALLAAIDADLVAGVTRSGSTLTFDRATGFTGTAFSFTLTAQDDAAVEGTEALALELSNLNNANGDGVITTATASTDITEIDQTVDLALSRSVASISEDLGESVDFTITLSQALSVGNSVSVEIGDVAGGADDSDLTVALLAAIDADLVAGVTRSGSTLTFDRATGFTGTAFSFTLTAQDDAAVEGTEALALELSNLNNANGDGVITTATASTDITEMDGTLQFGITATPSSISEEGSGTTTFTITLSNTVGAGNTATITLTQTGTATSGVDYTDFLAAVDSGLPAGVTRSGNVLSFDGDTFVGTSVSFDISATDDAVVEGTETVIATLINATIDNGIAAVDAGAITQTVDIFDTDVNTTNESNSEEIVRDQLVEADTAPLTSGSANTVTTIETAGSVLDVVEQATQGNNISTFEIGEPLTAGSGLFDVQGVKGFSISFKITETAATADLSGDSQFPLRVGIESELDSGLSLSEEDQLVIRSLLSERTLYIEVNYVIVSNPDLSTSSYAVTLANGDPLPSWLRLDDKGGLISGEPPVDIQNIHLRVEIILSDGTTIIRYVSVDTFTGEITAMHDANNDLIAGTQTFTEQLNGAANGLDQVQNGLIAALKQ